MKNKEIIVMLISTFSVVGLLFILVFTNIKDNYSNTVNYSGKTITITRVENGKVKNSSVAKTKSHAIGTVDLNIPEMSMDKKKVKARATSSDALASEVINMTPSPSYSFSNAKRNSSALPTNFGNMSRSAPQSGNNVSMAPIALLDNSKNNIKTTNAGYISTTSDLTSPKSLAGQKFNAGGSPPPSEKEPPSLPIGDGWIFLILLAVVYAGLRKWLL